MQVRSLILKIAPYLSLILNCLIKDSVLLGDRQNVIEVKMTVKLDSTMETEINTTAKFKLLQKEMTREGKISKVTIHKDGEMFFVLRVQHNPKLIPTNFVYTYFSKNNTSVTKRLNGKYGQHSFCYFTGHVDAESETIVSLDFCDKVKGVIDYPSRTYSIKTVMSNSQPKYYLSIQRDLDRNNFSLTTPYLNRWILQKRLANVNRSSSKKRFSNNVLKRMGRELKPSGGIRLKTYFIETYVVLDNALYIAMNSSVSKTVQIGFEILNYAAALYKPLDIYIIVVGMEVWSNGNKFNYTRALDRGVSIIDADNALDKLILYNKKDISYRIPNDNIQLISNENFKTDLIGKGYIGAMCSAYSAGINRCHIPDYTKTASVLAHEMAHAFKIPHVDEMFKYRTDCQCHSQGTSSFLNCIMTSAASK